MHAFFNLKEKFPQILFVLVNFLVALYLICFHFHPATLDLSGHISSAKYFSQGYFYEFDDNHFTGYIHNLFYPPLQDLCITIISFFTHKNFVQAGVIYVTLMYFFYVSSLAYVSGLIKNKFVQTAFLILVTLWLFLDKNNGVGLGTSLHDLLFMGLSAQFLGTIFFLILLRMVIENKTSPMIALLMALSFIGHIFVGLFSIALLIGYGLTNRKYLYLLLLGLGMSCFVWIPFGIYSKHIVSYTIFDHYPSKLISLLILNVILYILFRKKYSVLFIGSFFIFLMNLYGNYVDPQKMILPSFHYYRLMAYGYLFLTLELCLYFSGRFSELKDQALFLISFSFIVFTFWNNSAQFIKREDFLKFNFQSNNMTFVDNPYEYSRTYIMPNYAPEDQTFPQYLQSLPENEFKSAQGIYWGASKNDYLISSYNTILFKTRHGMIDYFSILPPNCQIEMCFFDQFIRDYNIGTFILDPTLNSNSLPQFQKLCMINNMWNKKTIENNFTYKGKIDLNYPDLNKKIDLNVYQVSNIHKSAYNNNSPLEIVNNASGVLFYDINKKFYYGDYFKTMGFYCEQKVSHNDLDYNLIFLPDHYKNENLNLNFSENPENVPMSKLKFEKVKINHYKIIVDTEKPVWFKIKLAWFPDFKLRDKEGHILPLLQGIGYMIGYGKGEMELIFQKSNIFYFSYAVSTISFILFIVILLFRNRFMKRNPLT